MLYSQRVIDHFENPRNVGSLDENDPNVGTGQVGSAACGDVLRLQIKVENNRIIDVKFLTYGCCSAIASTSLATEWLKGKTLEEALLIKDTEIAKELELPAVKVHCSVLCEDSILAAIEDYKKKQLSKQGV